MKTLLCTFFVLLFVLLLSACARASNEPQPPEILYGQDLCDASGMIIDDARFPAATLLTNGEFRKFASGHTSGKFEEQELDKDDHPAVNVSWEGAARFCHWLSKQANLPEYYRFDLGKVVGVEQVIHQEDVANLLAVTVDGNRLAGHCRDDEPRHPTLIFDAKLPRAIDARLTEDGGP